MAVEFAEVKYLFDWFFQINHIAFTQNTIAKKIADNLDSILGKRNVINLEKPIK